MTPPQAASVGAGSSAEGEFAHAASVTLDPISTCNGFMAFQGS